MSFTTPSWRCSKRIQKTHGLSILWIGGTSKSCVSIKLQTDCSCSQVPGLRPTGSRRKKRPGLNLQERTRENPVDRVLAQRARRAEAHGKEQLRRAEGNGNELSHRAEANRNGQPRHSEANRNEHPHRPEANNHCGKQPRIPVQSTHQSPANSDGDHTLHQPPHSRPILLGSDNEQADQVLPRLRRDGQHPEGEVDIEEEDEREAREEQEEQARRLHAEKHESARLEKVAQSLSLPPRRPSLTVQTNQPLRDSGPSGKKRVSFPFLLCFPGSSNSTTASQQGRRE
jgi:hypothetical protein